MQRIRDHVRTHFKNVPLNDNQLGALYAFCFNMGFGTLRDSPLAKRILAGDDPNTVAMQELPKYVTYGGKEQPGLVNRREAEMELFTR